MRSDTFILQSEGSLVDNWVSGDLMDVDILHTWVHGANAYVVLSSA